MYGLKDLKAFFKEQDINVVIAADGETRSHETVNHQLVLRTPAGGVSVGFDALARASSATYIARGKTFDDQLAVDRDGKVHIGFNGDSYTLKRLFLSERDTRDYYYGFSNQTLWPLCHAAFERPVFNKDWFEGYARVNRQFADAIADEIGDKKTFVWINDYQLSLVPTYLGKRKDVAVGFFWHIPWPTWEIFRTLPQKRDILWSLLSCDFLAFHRGYQMRNFMETVSRELEARIDEERGKIYFDEHTLKVMSLPMGIDTDVIESLVKPQNGEGTMLADALRKTLGIKKSPALLRDHDPLHTLFERYKIILGVDRLDYTKGILERLDGIDRFLDLNPEYRE